jgi:thioredoxin 1
MKKNILYLIAIIFLISGATISSCQTSPGKTVLDPASFDATIKSTANAVVIDVRTPEEFSKGHLQNAKNIDWNGANFDKQTESIDKTKPVFVYCLSGGRSSAAAAKMRSNGFTTVYELEGGIMKWRAANLPETMNNTAASTGMTKSEFDALLQSDKIMLVDFYAEWCEPCKKMKPYLEAIAKEMPDKVTVIRIDVDENQALAKAMKIEGLPVIQIYKNKAMTWSHLGYLTKDDIEKELQ